MKTDIIIKHHGRELHAAYYQPYGLETYPMVLMSHGYNGHQSDFDKTCEYYENQGMGCIALTFCGGSTRDISGYPSTEMTLFTEKEDLLALLEYAKADPKVEKDKIFMFGASQGGLVSSMAAAEAKSDVAGLILLYPAFQIADNWRKNFPTIEEIPEEKEFWNLKLGKKFFIDMRDFQVFDTIGAYEGPVLILQGTADIIARASIAKKGAACYKNCRLEMFQDEPHGFSEDGNRRMEAMMLYFIHETL